MVKVLLISREDSSPQRLKIIRISFKRAIIRVVICVIVS